MKITKIFARIFCFISTAIIIVLIFFTACGSTKIEVERKIINREYTAPSDTVETDYVYKYNFLAGEFVLVPEIKTVHKNAEYKIQYRVYYNDGSSSDVWEIATKEEYEEATQ